MPEYTVFVWLDNAEKRKLEKVKDCLKNTYQ